ncbi:Lrp/AsnC ligand binding domain-containing protein [Elusimicrobiota bacterium]
MDWKNRSAYLMVKTQPGQAENVWKKTQEWPTAIGSWVVTGDWDVIVWVDAKNTSDVYTKAAKLRKMSGVTASSSHYVYEGHKNASWWWDWPCGAWVLWRGKDLNGTWKKTKNWDWAVSSASVPGDWDWITYVGGWNWNDVCQNQVKFQKLGWQTKTLVPMRTWWNTKWAKLWMKK